jgi:hypothetical protein
LSEHLTSILLIRNLILVSEFDHRRGDPLAQYPETVRRWQERALLREECTKSQWEEMLDNQAKAKAIEEAKRKEEAERIEQAGLLEAQNCHQFFGLDESVAASQLKGRRLKVIVKVCSSLHHV